MIFFLHIPKTAGTTFYEVVKNNHVHFLKPKIEENPLLLFKEKLLINTAIRLPGGYKTSPEILKLIEHLPNNEVAKIDFIGGHVGYGFHHQSNKQINYISFIRDPEERIKSDYKEHCKKGRYFYNELKDNNFSFNYYLQLLIETKLDNLFTRQLAGPFDFFLNERNEINEYQFNLAKKNSKNIVFFNLNNFDEALHFIKKKYDWKNCNYTIKNKSSNSKLIKGYDYKLMEKVIYYDQQLCNSITVVNPNKFTKLQRFKFNLLNKF